MKRNKQKEENMSWNEYVLTLREIEQYQVDVKRKHARNKKMYTMGKQDAGSAFPKKVKADSRSKSAPPLGEEVEADSFKIKETLEPSIWPRGELDPDIARRLKDIVDGFIENLDIDINIEDIRFTGSLANYNWSNYSDIDLHIIVDFTRFKSPRDIVNAPGGAGVSSSENSTLPLNLKTCPAPISVSSNSGL